LGFKKRQVKSKSVPEKKLRGDIARDTPETEKSK